jgi:UDP-N-acetylmuramoyl-tripeptide--D-alanyl-D-alanine ligase
MLELGIYSKEEHENALKLCLEYKFKNIFTIGNHFNTTSVEAKEIIKFERIEVFKKYLKKQNILFDFVLIKGSRALELEGLIPFLKSK